MSKPRCKNPVSPHARRRISERYEGSADEYELSRNALHFGIMASQLQEGSPLRGYLEDKISYKDKIVRMLNGYVFIFSKGKRMITMYKVAEQYQEEAQSLLPLQEENRKAYKRKKENRKMKNR